MWEEIDMEMQAGSWKGDEPILCILQANKQIIENPLA